MKHSTKYTTRNDEVIIDGIYFLVLKSLEDRYYFLRKNSTQKIFFFDSKKELLEEITI